MVQAQHQATADREGTVRAGAGLTPEARSKQVGRAAKELYDYFEDAIVRAPTLRLRLRALGQALAAQASVEFNDKRRW